MDGFGVNTYTLVDNAGAAVLVKYHWKSRQGIESLTQADANEIQATNLGHASEDLFEAIERGEHRPAERYRTMPAWERDDLVHNLTEALEQCEPHIQERMFEHLTRCDCDFGSRVAERLMQGDVLEPLGNRSTVTGGSD